MRIYFVRHGETIYNKEGRFQGQSDVPLNETGKAQADAVARRLGDDFTSSGRELADIYYSPLSRTEETARAIGRVFDKTPTAESGFKEINMGEWEGKTPTELSQGSSGLDLQRWKEDPLGSAVPGGEHVKDVDERVMASLRKIVRSHGPNDNVVVVTHGGPIGVVITRVLKQSLKDVAKIKLDNASLTAVEVGGDLESMWLISRNDVSHLRNSSPT
jgi:broad specificity phosphatase PhoE